MSAKLTLFPPQGVARSFVFRAGRNHFAGRDPGSDIYLQDPRVSSRHALFQWTGSAGSWNLIDLRSKNGTFVNGSRITDGVPLQDADWMSFGGLLAFFERLSAAQAEQQGGERAARLDAAAAARLALVPNVDPRATLRGLLASAQDQLGAERGLLLLLDAEGGLHAAIASGFARYEPLDETFETGLTALRKTFETRRPVAALDQRSHSPQGKRRSFADLGRGAVACVPLSIPPWPRGFLEVDVRKKGGAFTELDLEILGSLADHAAVALAGAPLSLPVREIDGSRLPEGAAEERHILAQLERRIAGWAARESRPHRLTPIG